MNNLIELKHEYEKINRQIDDLKSYSLELIKKAKEIRNNEDIKFLAKYWKMLCELEKNKQPSLFKNYIVTAFQIQVIVCCGAVVSIYNNNVYLSELLDSWNNGFLYKSFPIVCLVSTNSGKRYVKYLNDDAQIKEEKILQEVFKALLSNLKCNQIPKDVYVNIFENICCWFQKNV